MILPKEHLKLGQSRRRIEILKHILSSVPLIIELRLVLVGKDQLPQQSHLRPSCRSRTGSRSKLDNRCGRHEGTGGDSKGQEFQGRKGFRFRVFYELSSKDRIMCAHAAVNLMLTEPAADLLKRRKGASQHTEARGNNHLQASKKIYVVTYSSDDFFLKNT